MRCVVATVKNGGRVYYDVATYNIIGIYTDLTD